MLNKWDTQNYCFVCCGACTVLQAINMYDALKIVYCIYIITGKLSTWLEFFSSNIFCFHCFKAIDWEFILMGGWVNRKFIRNLWTCLVTINDTCGSFEWPQVELNPQCFFSSKPFLYTRKHSIGLLIINSYSANICSIYLHLSTTKTSNHINQSYFVYQQYITPRFLCCLICDAVITKQTIGSSYCCIFGC